MQYLEAINNTSKEKINHVFFMHEQWLQKILLFYNFSVKYSTFKHFKTSPDSDPEKRTHPRFTIINSIFLSSIVEEFPCKVPGNESRGCLIRRWQTSTVWLSTWEQHNPPSVSHGSHPKPLIPAYYFKLIKAQVGGGGYFKKPCAKTKSMHMHFI